MKKIYISGQITGKPIDEIKKKFQKVEENLQNLGYETVNPLKNGIPENAPWELHIAMDIVLLMACDTIYLLNDWHMSRGAMLEKNFAELTGKKIIYEETPDHNAIKQAIYEVTGFSMQDIQSRTRRRDYVYARIIYAFNAHKIGIPVSKIAKKMKKSHATISYYLTKYHDDYKFTPEFKKLADIISAKINFNNL